MMNKREMMLDLVAGHAPEGYTPAAFFLHFGPPYTEGRAAIERHLEFFRYTGMDFVKIQFEQGLPEWTVTTPADWGRARRLTEDDFAPTVEVVRGLVEAAGNEALVVLTLYSPFMWARHLAGDALLEQHLRDYPEEAVKALDISAENVLTLARAAKKAGVDGFYASTQGGEAFRFGGTNRFSSADIFERLIKPFDLRVWAEIGDCPFNILHVCDFEALYADLTPFLDYPGHLVNAPLHVGERVLSLREAAALFGRPFMGGLERKGALATGTPEDARRAAERALAEKPERFVLAADCTVPGETPWENLKAAVEAAHRM
jgi:uroporphyrinogen decarboxylase